MNLPSNQGQLKSDDGLCSFCQSAAVAVNVERPLPHRRKKRAPQVSPLVDGHSVSGVASSGNLFSLNNLS